MPSKIHAMIKKKIQGFTASIGKKPIPLEGINKNIPRKLSIAVSRQNSRQKENEDDESMSENSGCNRIYSRELVKGLILKDKTDLIVKIRDPKTLQVLV